MSDIERKSIWDLSNAELAEMHSRSPHDKIAASSDIERMARSIVDACGGPEDAAPLVVAELERFAALIRADERERLRLTIGAEIDRLRYGGSKHEAAAIESAMMDLLA